MNQAFVISVVALFVFSMLLGMVVLMAAVNRDAPSARA
jgi:hypothetical protein